MKFKYLFSLFLLSGSLLAVPKASHVVKADGIESNFTIKDETGADVSSSSTTWEIKTSGYYKGLNIYGENYTISGTYNQTVYCSDTITLSNFTVETADSGHFAFEAPSNKTVYVDGTVTINNTLAEAAYDIMPDNTTFKTKGTESTLNARFLCENRPVIFDDPLLTVNSKAINVSHLHIKNGTVNVDGSLYIHKFTIENGEFNATNDSEYSATLTVDKIWDDGSLNILGGKVTVKSTSDGMPAVSFTTANLGEGIVVMGSTDVNSSTFVEGTLMDVTIDVSSCKTYGDSSNAQFKVVFFAVPTPPAEGNPKTGLGAGAIVGIVLGSFFFLLILFIIAGYIIWKKENKAIKLFVPLYRVINKILFHTTLNDDEKLDKEVEKAAKEDSEK